MADLSEFVFFIKIQGALVDIMCDVNDDFKKYTITGKGKKELYLKLTKALYGCM